MTQNKGEREQTAIGLTVQLHRIKNYSAFQKQLGGSPDLYTLIHPPPPQFSSFLMPKTKLFLFQICVIHFDKLLT